MNRQPKSRRQNSDQRTPSLALRPIAAALLGMLFAANTAYAQQAPASTAEEAKKKVDEKAESIVVIGIRHAIETSVAAKKNSDSIVEVISAEDIGKLPDVSIAESLARLPGLAAQRVDGRAQVISIRGLAPKYGTTLLNGREMVSTGDNRSVEFDQFPSELVNSATVYKTPDATLAGQGLSGTVDMQILRPLDYRGRQVNANVRGEHNSNGALNQGSSANGNRISLSYIDQFANNTIGLALGFAHLENTGQEKHYKSWWWANTGNWGAPLAGTPSDSVALQGFEAGVASTERKRDGFMSVIEFKPNKDFHSTVDLYYSKFAQLEQRHLLMSDLSTWGGASYTGATTTLVNGDKIVTGGNIAGVTPVDLNVRNKRDDKIFSAGWNNKFKLDKWTATTDLSYSKAKRDEYNAELEAGAVGKVGFSNIRIPVDNGVGNFTPTVDFSSAANVLLRDPAGWGRDGRAQTPKVDDELKSFRLSAKRDLDGIFNIFSNFDTGINYSDRTKKMNRTEVVYNLKNNRAPVVISPDLLQPTTPLDFAGVPKGIVAWDFMGALGKYYDVAASSADQAPGRIWDVQEKVTTAHVKMGIDVTSQIPIRGNIGLQAVRANQHSNGLAWDGKQAVPISGGDKYTHVLPSLNLVFDMGADAYVRFGAAKTMARPNMEDMRAGFSGINVDKITRVWSANGGNPKLEPWTANAYDLSFEKYFGKRSYVAAAVFNKDVRTFVYSQKIRYDFTGFPNPTAIIPISNIGDLSTQANGRGGKIEGIELSGALDGGVLFKPLDGFGVTASASDTRSSLHEENNPTKPLDGLSGRVYNTTLYFEKYGFSARIAQRYRSKFVTTVRGTFGENVPSAIGGERIADFQMGYAFENGPAKNLSILFQINNLRDTPYRTSVGVSTGSVDPNATLPERFTTYGRQYLLGVTYKM